jgi:hypothetical protein
VQAEERFGIAKLVPRKSVEQDRYLCGCAWSKTTFSGFKAGEQRVDGWRHLNSGWLV